MNDTMTPRHRQVYDFIREYVGLFGYAPTQRDIGAAVGLKSTSSVNSCLTAMQKLGYLTFEAYSPRTIKLNELQGDV